MLLFGMFSGGMTYSDHMSITNAVREGARFGAAIDYTRRLAGPPQYEMRVQQVYFNAGRHADGRAGLCLCRVQRRDDSLFRCGHWLWHGTSQPRLHGDRELRGEGVGA